MATSDVGDTLMSDAQPKGTLTATNPDTDKESTAAAPEKESVKTSRKMADYWAHFEFVEGSNQTKCKCLNCGEVYKCHSKFDGTTNLRNHIKKGKCKGLVDSKQTNINLARGGGGDEYMMSNWKFDKEECRKALAYMVIVDELPFRFVESDGFRRFCSVAVPRFQIPSRITVAKDCYALFVDERENLKMFLKSDAKRISITTDTWTSVQRINYMCLTAHFIDNNWKLSILSLLEHLELSILSLLDAWLDA